MIKKEDLNVGDTVFFPHKGGSIEAKVIKKNQKTATVKVDKFSYRVPYLLLFKDGSLNLPIPPFEKSDINKDEDLFSLLTELKSEYEIFQSFDIEQRKLLDSVKVKWNPKITYRVGGNYFKHKRTGGLRNEILISRSFKNAPKYLIKYILYHELLHIKFKNHSEEFRKQEQKFENYEKAKELFEVILLEIRINGTKRLQE
jgi:hypothetical protein